MCPVLWPDSMHESFCNLLLILLHYNFYLRNCAGFSEATRGCCGTGTVETTIFLCNPKSPGTCSNATQYVFWDSVHPSQAANQVLADSLILEGIDLIGWICTLHVCTLYNAAVLLVFSFLLKGVAKVCLVFMHYCVIKTSKILKCVRNWQLKNTLLQFYTSKSLTDITETNLLQASWDQIMFNVISIPFPRPERKGMIGILLIKIRLDLTYKKLE